MIPVFEPSIGEDEVEAVSACVRKGEISGSFGPSITKFEEEFAAYCESGFGVATTSGTTALHLAIAALGIKPGDEVIVSSCTNIATALCVFHQGGVIVPIDSERETWNLDLDLIEKQITPRTKAIIPVHIYGHPVDMVRLNAIAKKHNIVVIEDCAEAHGATIHGKKAGSFGLLNCFSFYVNKIITTGEGGMVVTADRQMAEKLKSLRNLSFTEPRFRHIEAGYNFRMTAYQAAMGLVQVRKIEQIIADKRRVAALYNRYLGEVTELQLPVEKPWARNVYWMYGVVLTKQARVAKAEVIGRLKQAGVDTRSFFFPMSQQPCFTGTKQLLKVECPVADWLWENGFYLPSSANLTESQVQFIADALKKSLRA